MRIEVAGANVTESVAEVLETLQEDPKLTRSILARLNSIGTIVNASSAPNILELIEALQVVCHMVQALAFPPEVNAPENDIPLASF